MNKVYPDHLQAYKDFAFDRIQNKVVFLSRLKDGEQRDVQGFQAMCSLGWSVAHNIVLETEFRKCFLEAYHANGLLNDKGEHSFDGALRRALRASINDPLPKLPSKYLSRKTKQKKHFSDAHLLAKGYKLSDFYTYTDAKGTPVFEKCKYVHPQKQKKFLYRHQEHNNGLYFFGKGPHPDYPFGLTDLLSQKDCPVLVCEGEKDAQNAKDILGLPAVSINDWKACTSYFEGRDVYIVPDQDKAGRQKAKKAYTHLISVARSAIIVNLQCAEGEDFTDWLNQDKSIEDFWALVAAQQEQHPTQPLEIQTLMIEKCSPHLTVESISQILANTGQVFVRGGYIVELQPEHSLGEEEFRHRITDIRKGRLQTLVHKNADVLHDMNGQETACALPLALCSTVLEQGTWEHIPHLSGISSVPILTKSNQICTQPGYHPETGLYIDITADGWDEVADPLKELTEWFAHFPFEAKQDQAIHLAALLTSVIRPSLKTAPAFCYSATEAGSGKTLLATCCAILANGTAPSVIGYSYDNAEIDKQLDGFLLGGQQCVIFDNLNKPFGNDKICSLLTSPNIEIRKLGGSTVTRVENKLLIFATGNGLSLNTDMDRRALVCRLDANEESPQSRQFEFYPPTKVKHNRKDMVMAALQLLRDAAKQTHPITKRVGSFEDWGVVVDAVYLATGFDIGALLRNPDTMPEEKYAFSLIVNHWHENRLGKLTAKDISQAWDERHGPEPNTALVDLADLIGGADTARKGNPRKIGHYLNKVSGRVANNLKLMIEKDKKRGHKFEVRTI